MHTDLCLFKMVYLSKLFILWQSWLWVSIWDKNWTKFSIVWFDWIVYWSADLEEYFSVMRLVEKSAWQSDCACHCRWWYIIQENEMYVMSSFSSNTRSPPLSILTYICLFSVLLFPHYEILSHSSIPMLCDVTY